MDLRKLTVPFLLLLTLLTGICIANDNNGGTYRLEVSTIAGEIKPLTSDNYSTLLYFTGLGCRFCHYFEAHAMPDLLERISKEQNIELTIIAYGDSEEIRDKYSENTIPVFIGSDEIWDLFEVVGVPSFFLVSADGKVEWSQVGFPRNGNTEHFSSLWSHISEPH